MTGYANAVWRCDVQLSCGHGRNLGLHETAVAEGLAPRRKDGSFGAVRCPIGCGRRRVTRYGMWRVDRLVADVVGRSATRELCSPQDPDFGSIKGFVA